MTDAVPEFTLGELATRFGLELKRGEAGQRIRGVHTLERADATQLSFFANSRYRSELAHTAAAVVVLKAADLAECPVPALIAKDPYLAYAQIAALFQVRARPVPGVHVTAVVEAGAVVDPGASVGAFCHVAASARIEAGALLGPYCQVGPDCCVGPDCELIGRVTLVKRVRLGARVLIHPGAVLGADGFGLARNATGWIKVPQLGGVRIGDDCEIGANSSIDCGAIEDTELAVDVRIDNQVQIGHNVRIGAHTAIAGCVGIAGSAEIGANCLIGGACGIGGHIRIAAGTTVLGMSMVTHDIHQPGVYAGGPPLMDNAGWRRNMARLRKLDELARRVNKMQKDHPQGRSTDEQ